MSIDKTPEDRVTEAQADQLDESQLAKAAGGLLPAVRGIAVDPSDPSGGTYNPSASTFYLRNSN